MSLIGDCIMSLPILDHLKTIYPNSYIYFSLAKKCQQAKFLFENHPNIDEVKISDYEEELGPSDFEIIKNCDIVINPRPNHPLEFDWYNHRSCVQETFIMAGLDLKNLKTLPKLNLLKPRKELKNTIAFWPFAGYGKGISRSPSKEWWERLLSRFKNFQIFQFGSEQDPHIDTPNLIRNNHKNFEQQILESLNCSIIIGTDSGSMWVTGAYGVAPQINLLTNWLPGHFKNFSALAPEGEKCYNFFAQGSCDNISTTDVQNKIIELINI